VGDRRDAGDWQVLVATSTLAWGVNSPTHLVIIKGTEFFDAKQHRYVDMPITDVLQMMGRAGRPQFDDSGKAVIFVHDIKKDFYKKFLYEPFPVESSLHTQLTDHLNAEVRVGPPCTGGPPGRGLNHAWRRRRRRRRCVSRAGSSRQVVAGTIQSKQDGIEYLHWTYYYRRVLMNPSYYGLADTSAEALNNHLAALIENCLIDLENAGCIGKQRPPGEAAVRPMAPLSHAVSGSLCGGISNETVQSCTKSLPWRRPRWGGLRRTTT